MFMLHKLCLCAHKLCLCNINIVYVNFVQTAFHTVWHIHRMPTGCLKQKKVGTLGISYSKIQFSTF